MESKQGGSMRLILICLLMGLTGCAGSSDNVTASAPGTNPGSGPGPTPPVTRDVVVSTGHNYSCVLESAGLICWGNNPTLSMPSSPTVIVSGITITGLQLYDHTICVSGTVGVRPVSHAAGPATYCFGDANVNSGGYAGQPVVFSPPVQQSDISTELITWILPYAASDLAFTAYMSLGTILDSSNDVTSSLVTCTQNGSAWDCGSFTL